MKIVLVSLNIWKGGAGKYIKQHKASQAQEITYTGQDVLKTYDHIAELINAHNADIVALQEVDCKTKRIFRLDGPQEISNRLTQRQPKTAWRSSFFKAETLKGGGEYGLTNLTKLQPRSQREWVLGKALPEEENHVAISDEYVINNGNGPISFYVINVHFGLCADDQAHQIQVLREIIENTSPNKPIIICGDLNIYETGSSLDYCGLQYDDLMNLLNAYSSRRIIDLGPTNAVTFPKSKTKIDYMFFSDAPEGPAKDKLKFNVEVISGKNCSDHNGLKLTISCGETNSQNITMTK